MEKLSSTRKRWTLILRSIAITVILLVGFAAVLILRPENRLISDPGLTQICASDATPAPFTATIESTGAIFPCQPTRYTVQTSTPIGNIPIVYYASDVGSSHYEIMVADYGSVFSGDLTGILRGIVLDRTKASTLDEFQVTEKSTSAISMNDLSGSLITAENATRAARIKLYAVGKKLYRISVLAPLDQINDPRYTAFLDSFTITVSP